MPGTHEPRLSFRLPRSLFRWMYWYVVAALAVEVEHASGARRARPEDDPAGLDRDHERAAVGEDVVARVAALRAGLAEVVVVGDRPDHGEEDLRRRRAGRRDRGCERGRRERGGEHRPHELSTQSPRCRIGTSSPSAVTPEISTSAEPIMKSVWIDEWLIPRAWRSSGASSAAPSTAWTIDGAERDVRRGVLVEERVVEDEPGPPDARGAVDERDLAEPRGAVVGRGVRPHQLLAVVRADLDGAAALEAHLEPADDRALDLERVGRADDAVDAARVGRREHLLGRHVRDVPDPDRLVERRLPRRLRMKPDGEVGARAAVPQRVEAPRVQRVGAPVERGDVVLPRRDRVRLVEPHSGLDRAPEPLEVRLAEDRGRPALVRVRDDRPVAAAARELEARAGEVAHPRARDARAVEVGEELRLRVPADREQRAAVAAELLHALDEPRRRPREHVLARVLDVRAADVLVGEEDVDVAGAGHVGLLRDRAHERRVLDEAVDRQPLARLEVEPDPDGQARVVGQPVA